MSDPIPISLPALEIKRGQQEMKQMVAQQVVSEERFIDDVDNPFNPAAAARAQARFNRFRPLETRKKEAEQKGKIAAVGQKTEEDLAHDFHKRNPELPIPKLQELRARISEESTEEEILENVIEMFRDPTLADEALDYLGNAFTGALQARVQRARELYREEKGREILAGRNIAPVVKIFYNKGLGDSPSALRDLYRDITGNPKDHNTLFTELSKQYGFDDLKLVVTFLLQGMGYDLKSKGPSIQQAELQRLMTEIKNLQSILWIYLFFKGRMRLVRSLFAQYEIPFTKSIHFEKLAKEFIKLVEERYPTVMKLLKELEEMGLIDNAKIILLSQYRDAIRELSPRVYKSPRHQQDLLLLILQTMEELEERIAQ